MNDTVCPEQIVVLGEGKMAILGTKAVVTVIVVVKEVAVEILTQFELDVITQ